MSEFFLPNSNIDYFESQRAQQGFAALSRQEEKILNSMYTMQEKASIAKPLMTQKYQNLDGFEDATIVRSTDGDTFKLRLKDGQLVNARMQANDSSFLDAIETSHYGSSPLDTVEASSFKRQVQPDLVAGLTGKPKDQLTDEDYNLVGRQAQSRVLNSLRGDGTGQLDGWQEGEEIPVSIRINGQDEYGRYLTEFVNPLTREAVSTNLAYDPTFNAGWSIKQIAMNSPDNMEAINRSITDRYKENFKLSGFDPDGRIGEDLDLVQSAAYGMARRFLNVIDSGVNSSLKALTGREYKRLVPDLTPEQSQALTDSIAGVTQRTRQDFAMDMQDAGTSFDNGDYGTAFKMWIGSLDRVIAESMPSMAASTAGMALTGGTSLAAQLGGGTLAKLAAAAIGQSLAAADMTLATMDQYKANNNGKSMDAEDAFATFMLNVGSLVPGTFLAATQWQKALPKKLTDKFFKSSKYQASQLPSKGGLIAREGGEEFLQENFQTSLDTYASQNEDNKRSFGDIISKEGLQGGIVGALAGGALAGVGQYNPVTLASNYSQNKAMAAEQTRRDNRQKDWDTTSYSGKPINQENIDFAQKVLASATQFGDTQEHVDALVELERDYGSTLNKATMNMIQQERINIQKRMAQADPSSLTEEEKDELLDDVIFASDPNGLLDTQGRITPKENEKRTKEVVDTFKSLGRTEDQAKKRIEQVSQEVVSGQRDFIGYETYRNELDALETQKAALDPNSPDYASQAASIDQDIIRTVTNAVGFRNGQNAMLENISQIAHAIARGDITDQKLNKSAFVVKGAENLHKDSYASAIGTHGIVKSAIDVVNNMDDILSRYNQNGELPLLNFKNVNSKLESYKSALATIQSKTVDQIMNPQKSAVSKAIAKVTGKTPTPTKVEPKTSIPDGHKASVLELLDRQVTRGGKESKNLSTLRANYTQEAWQAFRDAYAKDPKADKKILSFIDDSILQVAKETKEAVDAKAKDASKVADLIKTATEQKSLYTDAVVDAVKTFEDYAREGRKVAELTYNLVRRASYEPENKELAELAKFYADYRTKLIAKREAIAKAAFDEAKSAEEASVDTNEETPVGEVGEDAEESTEIGVARRIFKTVDIYKKRIASIRHLVSDFGFTDKEAEIDALMKQHAEKLDQYELLLGERESLEEDLTNGESTNVKNKQKLTDKNTQYKQDISRLSKDKNPYNEKRIKKLQTLIKSNETRLNNYYQPLAAIRIRIEQIDNFYLKEIAPIQEQIKLLLNDVDNNISKTILSGSTDSEAKKLLPGLGDSFEVKPRGASSILGSITVDTKNPIISRILYVFNNMTPKAKTIEEHGRKRTIYSNILEWLHGALDSKQPDNGTRLDASPYLRLLYSGEFTDETHSKLNINPEVAVAIDLAIRQHLTNNSIGDLFTPFKSEELKKRFPNSEDINIYEMRAFNNAFGVPGSVLATQIGEKVLQYLGITATKKSALEAKPQLTATLGRIALDYAVARKWVIETTVPMSGKAKYVNAQGEKVAGDSEGAIKNILNYNTPMIRFNSKPTTSINPETQEEVKGDATLDVINKDGEVLAGFLLDSVNEDKPSVTPLTPPENMDIRNTNQIGKAGSYVKNIMKKLYNTKFAINKQLVDWVREHQELAKDYMEFSSDTEITGSLYETQEGLKGKNLEVNNQVNYLLELDNWNAPDYYFSWFLARNARLHVDSNHANPQGGKALQRFLLTTRNSQRIFSKTNKEQLNEAYFTLAQAFDRTGTDKEIEAFGKAILKISAKELRNALESKTLVGKGGLQVAGKGVKIENFGQVLTAIQFIEQYQNTGPKGKFRTFLTVENDATTSGVANSFLQHPSKDLEVLLPKVGVVSDGDKLPLTEIHNLKGQTFKGDPFLDIYETTADVVEAPENMKGLFADMSLNQKAAIIGIGQAEAGLFYKYLRPLLPAKKEGKVTKSLRKLVKPGTMTYFYGQGGAGLASALGDDISESLLVEFLKVMKGTSDYTEVEQNQLKKLFDVLTSKMDPSYEMNGKKLETRLTTLAEMLVRQSSQSIKMAYTDTEGDAHNPSLKYVLGTVIETTYGNAVFQALDTTFGQKMIGEGHTLNELNASKSLMVNTEFDLFVEEYTYESNKLKAQRKAEGKVYSQQDELDVINSLFDVMPTMRLLYNEFNEVGLIFLDTERAYDPNSTSRSLYMNSKGDLASHNVSANIRKFIDVRASGGVLSTQSLDGTIMFSMLERYADQILGIHDAIQGSGVDSASRVQYMNKLIYLINKEYNLYDMMYNGFTSVLNNVMERRMARGMTADEAVTDVMLKHNAFEDKNKTWTKYFYNLQEEFDEEQQRPTKKKIPLTIWELYDRVTLLNGYNTQNRDTYYNQFKGERVVGNVDGYKSLYKVNHNDTLAEMAFISYVKNNAQAIAEAFGSDPNGYTPSSQLEHFREFGAVDETVRVQVAERLRALDTKQVSDSYMEHIKSVILNRVSTKALNNLVVTVVNNNYNTGIIARNSDLGLIGIDPLANVIEVGLDDSSNIDTVSGLSPKSLMSAVEIYAHELLHAGTRLPILNHKTLKLTNEVNELLDLQRKASKIVTWETFMPDKGSYDPALQADYEQMAHEVWNYIFTNPDINNLRGLHEFISYGLTNQKMIDALNSTYIPTGSTLDKVRFLDRLVSLGIALLDVFRGKGRISEVFNTAKKVVKGDLNLRNQESIYNELIRLNDRLQKINQKAVNKLQSNSLSMLQDIVSFLGSLILQGNQKLRPIVNKWFFNLFDEGLGMQFQKTMQNIHGNGLLKPLRGTTFLLSLPFSKSRRDIFGDMVKMTTGASQQGVFLTILRDMQEPNAEGHLLNDLARYGRMTEQAAIAKKSLVKLNLKENFNRELTEDELRSLTRVMLYTDLSLLANIEDGKITNMDYVTELIKDPSKVDAEIVRLEAQLQRRVPKSEQFNWYMNSIESTAMFMTSGRGTLVTAMNARVIASGQFSGDIYSVNEGTIDVIDRLITLKALNRTDPSNRRITGTLDVKGLENMLIVQDEFKRETRESVLNNNLMHEQKGYTKTLADPSIDMKIAPIADAYELEQQNYVMVQKLGNDSFTGTKGRAMYIRKWSPIQSRNGAAFILANSHAMGQTLTDSAFAMQAELDKAAGIVSPKSSAIALQNIMFDEARKKSKRMANLYKRRRLTSDMLNRLTDNYGGYTPIASTNGGASDFRLIMSTENKQKFLGLDEDAFEVLGRMFASNVTKIDSKAKNRAIIHFLEDDMIQNMNQMTKHSKEGKRYVQLEENSTDPFIKDAFKAMPKELRNRIKDAQQHGEGFWVREEWLAELFGQPSVSVIDNETVAKVTNARMKFYLVMAEYIMKTITYFAKQNIVIRYPFVMINNIISNFNLIVGRGFNPATVMTRKMENAKWIREYVEIKKKLNSVEFKQKLGTASKDELSEMPWMRTKLNSNPVKPLMDVGMYQAIIEDLDPNEIQNVGPINKIVNAKLKNTPKWLRSAFRHAYLMEGNPYYDFMFQTTQYSDFVARATLYQLTLEQAEKKELRRGVPNKGYVQRYQLDGNGRRVRDSKTRAFVQTQQWVDFEKSAIHDVWNAFINYDKPQSSKEQYLNDMGLVMFTKFLKRIQSQIFKGLSETPVSSLLFLLSQSAFMDTSDIYESQVPLMRGLGFNVSNPLDNLFSATVPVTIQAATGTGVFD